MDTDTRATEGPTSRKQLRRPLENRMLTGVAAGIADYLGIDANVARIGFVVLALIGGAGIPLYLAGLLLIPEEGSDQSLLGSLLQSVKS